MATLGCDVLVLGSSLGGLTTAAYLARLGLRVIVIEEEAQAKRPALLREPLLFSGLGPTGSIRRVLRELGVPLREQAQMEATAVSAQLVLPDTEIDLLAGREEWARELAAHRLLPHQAALAWLERSAAIATRIREGLWKTPGRGRLFGWWRRRERDESAVALDVPEPIEGLIRALLGALHPLPPAPNSAAAQLGVTAALEGGHRIPHTGDSILELLRGRFCSRHGAVHTTDAFSLLETGQEIEIGLPRGSFRARALVIAVPLEPLRRMLEETGGAPSWWQPVPEPLRCPARLFRIDSDYVPKGMSERVIVSGEGDDDLLWFSRIPDADAPRIEWLIAAGPGSSRVSLSNPLGREAPFLRNSVVPGAIGADPRWDFASSEVRLHHSPRLPTRSTRVPLVHVGPERAGLLGFEGEVLQARQAALRLAGRLGARRLL